MGKRNHDSRQIVKENHFIIFFLGQYVFNDGLLYSDKDWSYLSESDRRFYTEVKSGLRPAGHSLMTNEEIRKIF
jgi:hypothetical protein